MAAARQKEMNDSMTVVATTTLVVVVDLEGGGLESVNRNSCIFSGDYRGRSDAIRAQG